jgi:hypothetical protein
MNLQVSNIYVMDLRDDFLMNYDKGLYDFIDGDIVKAFYIGMYIDGWFKELERKQQYLHSKLLRHNTEGLDEYLSQIKYWTKEYPATTNVDALDLSEYLMNNIVWREDHEDEDKIRVAIFLGMAAGEGVRSKEIEEIFNIH